MNTAFFDCESTGVNPTEDRIVQIAVLKMDSDWNPVEPIKKMLLNPGRPIPAEATAVHGITDEMVKDAPSFANIQKGLASFLEGCVLAGFNILNYDVPLLAEEFLRCGRDWPDPGTKYLDAYRIFREKEKRDLAGAAKFYLGVEHLEAHDAGGDVDITWKVLASQAGRYPDLKEMSVDQLHTFCVGENAVDLAGKFIRNEEGKTTFAFGKYIGEVVKPFDHGHKGFLEWMLNPKQSFAVDTRKVASRILHGKSLF